MKPRVATPATKGFRSRVKSEPMDSKKLLMPIAAP